jgi:hypothetical protein
MPAQQAPCSKVEFHNLSKYAMLRISMLYSTKANLEWAKEDSWQVNDWGKETLLSPGNQNNDIPPVFGCTNNDQASTNEKTKFICPGPSRAHSYIWMP